MLRMLGLFSVLFALSTASQVSAVAQTNVARRQTSSQSATASGANTAASPEEKEARQILDSIWQQYLTKCGDSFYMMNQGESLVQFKDVSFDVSSQGGISRAEALNGLQWRGKAVMSTSVSRQAVGHFTVDSWTGIAQTQNLGWLPWSDGYLLAPISGIPFNANLKKISGKWYVGSNDVWFEWHPTDPLWPGKPYPQKISCSLLPPERAH